MDLRVTQIVDGVMLKLKQENRPFHERLGTLDKQYLAGSLREGSFSANFFNAVKTYPQVPSIDIDVAITGSGFLDKKHRHWIKDIKNKTGFVHIKIEKETEKVEWKEFLKYYTEDDQIHKQTINKDGYVKTYTIKDHFRKRQRTFRPRTCRLIIALFLDIPLRRVGVEQSRSVTKSTYEHTNNIIIDGQLRGIIHMDLPLLLQLDWPCPYYDAWRNRQRLWPDLELLSTELNISYLIAKTSRKEKNNTEATEFQYSFAYIENKIMSLLSSNQRTVFYTTKIIFKQWIKPYSEVYLPSFLVKNTMFWICEQTPADHHLWDFRTEKDFMNALRYLFIQLKGYLKDGFLPYYFIPQINLIEGIPPKLSQEAIATLDVLTLNVKNYLPGDESRVVVANWMTALDFVLYRAMDFIDASKNFGTHVAFVMSGKHAINNVVEYVNNKDGYRGSHSRWKTFLSQLKVD